MFFCFRYKLCFTKLELSIVWNLGSKAHIPVISLSMYSRKLVFWLPKIKKIFNNANLSEGNLIIESVFSWETHFHIKESQHHNNELACHVNEFEDQMHESN